MTSTPRDIVYSHLAHQIGGWNASRGMHMGRAREYDDKFGGDDEQLVRYFLERHESDVTYPLKQEIIKLKAQLFDLTHRGP